MFEVPGFVAPVTVTARTTIYARGDAVAMEHENIRVNGAALAGDSDTPRLPLLEPERITTPPLQISLTDAYAYKLDGTTVIHGAKVYIIAFGVGVAGQDIDLPGRTRIYQMYEGAGHRTPIHRAIDIEQHVMNPPMGRIPPGARRPRPAFAFDRGHEAGGQRPPREREMPWRSLSKVRTP